MKPILDIQTWRTSRDVPVYFVCAPELPMLDIRVVFRAGSARDEKQAGLADLTNALLDEGTHTLNADEIAKRLDAIGAIYRAGVRQDMTFVGMRSLTATSFLAPALDLFIQMLTQSTFPQDAFLRVQKQFLTNLESELQQPAAIAQRAFYAQLYGDHPYASSIIGTIPSVTQLTRDDVSHFYQQYYTAENAILLLVGNVTQQHAEQIAEQVTKDLPAGVAVAALPVAKPVAASHKAIEFPSQQTSIYLGQIAITPQDEQYFPLMVGNYSLGSGGMVSRLFDEVREKHGLVYGIHSAFLPLSARGPFSISLQTRNEETQRAISMTRDILADFVRTGPTAAELHAAQQNLVGSFPLELASNADALMQLIKIALYDRPLNYLDTYREQVNAVSIDSIRAAFQHCIQPDELVTVTVGKMADHGIDV